jgi:1,4-alpha-glucan branching enzyme
MSLVGDFSKKLPINCDLNITLDGWNTETHQYRSIGFGKWQLEVPARSDGSCPIEHNSILKIAIKKNGQFHFKLSPWANYVTCAKDSIVFHQVKTISISTYYKSVLIFKQFYNPSSKYSIKTSHPKSRKSLRIYEAHVGISSQEGKINSYRDFADNVIPHIDKQGLNKKKSHLAQKFLIRL